MDDVEKVLLEQVRSWLVDEKVGLISWADVVARADQAIMALDEVPYFLVALSLGETIHDVDRLDLLRGPLDRHDLAGLAARLLDGLQSGKMSLDDIAGVAVHFMYPGKDDLDEMWADLCWISDEAHLIDIGAKSGTNFERDVEQVLHKLAQS